MSSAAYSDAAGAHGWAAPAASGPLDATVSLPGSKSLTNRELVLAALADGPSRLRRPLAARDTERMIAGLRVFGTQFRRVADDLVVTPRPLSGSGDIWCGLAGTVMRFLPPVAALGRGQVLFDGDSRARLRPMAATILALRALGVDVDDDGQGTLPFTVRGTGRVSGRELELDASQSSQFVSGLLLAGARFDDGLDITHRGAALPSLPHIAMTVDVLARRGVEVEADPGPDVVRWTVAPQRIAGRDVEIEPDLSNAAPFLAAALVAGGVVRVSGWPASTTQVGDRLRGWLTAFGAAVHESHGALVVDGGAGAARHPLTPVDLDLSEGGELAPTLAGLAAFADGRSTLTGIAHLRGHETDRLAALVAELRAVGATAWETDDGLVVEPGALSAPSRPWRAYDDHRMATTGALVGLGVPGLVVDDVGTTAKTLPGFADRWSAMLAGAA